jgi:hypothetical protein
VRATVKKLTDDQEFSWSARTGESIEVIGWVHHDGQVWAIWRHDCGCVEELPSWAVTMEPHSEAEHEAAVVRLQEALS